MSVVEDLAYLGAGGLVVNGPFHFPVGMLGRKFVKGPRAMSRTRYENGIQRFQFQFHCF